ncbi:MAG: hypothetical protein JW864_08385 [Spirochaetes bacterium]|nr:hypothetical protein [Spirochaetota bacterium]
MHTIDNVFDEIEGLSFEEQEFIEQELKKRIVEKRRNEIVNQFEIIKNEIQNGKFKKGSCDDFLKDLNF